MTSFQVCNFKNIPKMNKEMFEYQVFIQHEVFNVIFFSTNSNKTQTVQFFFITILFVHFFPPLT